MKKQTIALLPLIAVLSLAIPEVVNSAHAQDNGKVLVPSSVVKLTSTAMVEGSGFIPSIAKKFLVPFPGVVRVRWKMKSGTSGRNASVLVSSVMGNCTTGTNLSTTSTAFVIGTCDIRVVAGDVVQVSVSGSPPNFGTPPFDPPSSGFMNNVSLSFNVQNGTGLGAVLP